MKNFLLELGATMIVSLVCIPATIIGLCAGGWLYGEKVEPWLKKTFKNQEEGGE